MPDREPSRMDRARAASERRDKARQRLPDQLSAGLQREARGPIPMPTKRDERGFRKAVFPKCPECPQDSLNGMSWDGRRGYYVCRRCRGTFTLEDLGLD